MNWVDVIKDIYRTLDAHGRHDVSFEIGEEHVRGGTPGEMFTLLVVKLMDIKKNRPEVYELIREETEWMIAYGKKIDYIQ